MFNRGKILTDSLKSEYIDKLFRVSDNVRKGSLYPDNFWNYKDKEKTITSNEIIFKFFSGFSATLDSTRKWDKVYRVFKVTESSWN